MLVASRKETLNESDPTAPDWALWRDIPTAGLDEAVALSLNVNPLFAPMLWAMFNEQDQAEHDDGTTEFARRLVIARNNIQPLGTLPVFGMNDTPPRCIVRLTDFAAFADSKSWLLPPEFPASVVDAGPSSLADHCEFKTTPDEAKSTGQQSGLKRTALIQEYSAVWLSIENDLKHSGSNDLQKEARLSRGWWDQQKALEWAKKRGKLKKS